VQYFILTSRRTPANQCSTYNVWIPYIAICRRADQTPIILHEALHVTVTALSQPCHADTGLWMRGACIQPLNPRSLLHLTFSRLILQSTTAAGHDRSPNFCLTLNDLERQPSPPFPLSLPFLLSFPFFSPLQPLFRFFHVFTRESIYCFQRVLVIVILSDRPSVRLSLIRVDQSKTVQDRITKSLPSAA